MLVFNLRSMCPHKTPGSFGGRWDSVGGGRPNTSGFQVPRLQEKCCGKVEKNEGVFLAGSEHNLDAFKIVRDEEPL